MPRATPLPADERRAAIMAATEPLLERHGREVSTRQIAEAAGIAEGTIFRVFATKEALIDAVVEDAFDTQVTVDELAGIDPDAELAYRLEQAVAILQRRLHRVIALFHSLRFEPPRPDTARAHRQQDNRRVDAALAELVGRDADRLRVSVDEAASVIRCLTFAVTHPMISDHRITDPRRIVEIVLNGIATSVEQLGTPPTPVEETRPC